MEGRAQAARWEGSVFLTTKKGLTTPQGQANAYGTGTYGTSSHECSGILRKVEN
jgi:hypothetical protein